MIQTALKTLFGIGLSILVLSTAHSQALQSPTTFATKYKILHQDSEFHSCESFDLWSVGAQKKDGR
jgi:hypothetical protein